ncbi:uncharacterized protein MELLADRAFT_68136 [Melampsora larici-populina 98AG31]|uniref:Uncharacterized protein n=1 Tax=Melampsora larici-populina (strain 98AG31 / pathotype 3-4-7) TaxID=747676 RepID=F4S5P6_MELLP|nr:uncharacterized protein MELLADRAFT_68136 [Melampsora larici-populina 98AG31]EGG00073.1 hypothetical protein MELLADRAFT_68136 [Melampsora larici-populina 98AG31]
MKSFRTMVFMSNWPISLTAMGVEDLSKIIGHSVSPTESHAQSHFTGIYDPALHQQEAFRSETYPSNLLHSRAQAEPPGLGTLIVEAPSSDASVGNLGEGIWEQFEDPLGSPGYYTELTQVLSQLPRTQADSPLYQLSADGFDGVLHDDGFHPTNPYDSVIGLWAQSEVHNEYTHVPSTLSHTPHIQPSQSPSGHRIPAEHPIDFLDSDLARIFEQNDNFDKSLGFQPLKHEPTAISRDILLQPPVPQVMSSIANGGRPHETFKDIFNHVTHSTPRITQPISPIPEARQASESPSNFGFGGSPSTFTPLLQVLSPARHSEEESQKHGHVSLLRSGQLKHLTQTHPVKPRSKRKNRPKPSLMDDNEGFVRQVKRRGSSKDGKIDTLVASTPPNQQPSRLRFKRPKVPAFDSETDYISRLEEYLHEATMSNDLVKIDDYQLNIKAMERYYGKSWHREKSKKKKLLKKIDPELDQKLSSNAHLPSISPRKLIDKYKPKIQAFLKLFKIEREFPGHTEYLQENMHKLLDNYLEILTICSEVVWSNDLHTNLEDDVREGYDWLMERLKGFPTREFDHLPIDGNIVIPTDDKDFIKRFDGGLSVYDGTAFWLTHKLYKRKRERVAAT